MAPELTSVYVLSASTNRAQPTALASVVGVDGVGSSAARGAGEVAHCAAIDISSTYLEGAIAQCYSVFA